MPGSTRQITIKGNTFAKKVQSCEKANRQTVKEEKVVDGNSNLYYNIKFSLYT